MELRTSRNLIGRAARLALLVAAPALGAQAAWADAKLDSDMRALATNSGCFICHHVESGAKGPNGMAPIGPNWEDVSLRYRARKDDVSETLVKTVLQGSNAYSSHWTGKVSGIAMPPNAVAISEEDARRLVHWILALKK
jgi:cytochrome c